MTTVTTPICTDLNLAPTYEALRREKLDALVVLEPLNVALLLNFWNKIHLPLEFHEFPMGVILLPGGEAIAINPIIYDVAPWKYIKLPPWISGSDGRFGYPSAPGQATFDLICRGLRERGLASARIGFELNFLPVRVMEMFRRELPGIEAVDAEWLLCELRACKTPRQIEFIKRAINATEAGLNAMLRRWREGERLQDIIMTFEDEVRRHGCVFFASYHNGMATEWSHCPDRDQYLTADFRLQRNDALEVDFDLLVYCQGYFSDWGRSIYLGDASEKLCEYYRFKFRVVRRLTELIRPGMTVAEADELCNETLRREGLAHWWCAHSVGLAIHEEPLIGGAPAEESDDGGIVRMNRMKGRMWGANRRMTYRPGMVMSLESGGGAEDPYLMSESGLQRLNTIEQELLIVP